MNHLGTDDKHTQRKTATHANSEQFRQHLLVHLVCEQQDSHARTPHTTIISRIASELIVKHVVS